MHRKVGLGAKHLRHCETTAETPLTCKMLALKQRAWDLLGCPGAVLRLLQGLDCHMRTESATLVCGSERDYSQDLFSYFVA